MHRVAVQTSSLIFLGTLLACGSAPVGVQTASEQQSALAARLPMFSICDGVPYEASPAQGFQSGTNAWWSRLDAHHTAQDMVTTPGASVNLGGLFAYGTVQRGVQHEDVEVSVNNCGIWHNAGTAPTDDEGHAQIPYTTGQVGRFDVVAQVEGDATTVQSHLHVFPRGTHVVVFDIDGTLTTDNGQFMRQLANNNYIPTAFTAAVSATKAWYEKGYMVVYLTGRPRGALPLTRQWLESMGFAPGPVHVTNGTNEIMPSNAGVGEFKRQYLEFLESLGYVVDYAYGNEPTDVYAYLNNDVAPDHIFTIGVNAGMYGTQSLPDSYAEHLKFIASHAKARQPFLF